MNVLTMEKAPFFLVLILGAIGWQVSQLVGYTEADEAAFSYRVKNSETATVVRIANRSKTKTLRGHFTLTCLRGQRCFSQGSAHLQELAATAIEGSVEKFSSGVEFNVVAPPYAAFELIAPRNPSTNPPRFFVRPAASDGVAGTEFYVYDGLTPTGFIRDNLQAIILGSLSLSSFAAVLYTLLLWRQGRRQRAKERIASQTVPVKSRKRKQPPEG